MLEMASKSVWELILDGNDLGKEITETVERVFCRLSGREPPLYPSTNVEAPLDKEKDEGKGKEKDGNVDNETEDSHSASKKRIFSEMNSE